MEGSPNFRSSGIHFPALLHQIMFFGYIYYLFQKYYIRRLQTINRHGGETEREKEVFQNQQRKLNRHLQFTCVPNL